MASNDSRGYETHKPFTPPYNWIDELMSSRAKNTQRGSSTNFVIPNEPWAKETEKLTHALDVSPDLGLDPTQVMRRRAQFGKNILRKVKKTSPVTILLNQFKSLIVLILVVAVLVSIFFNKWIEAVSISAVIVINAFIGFFTEYKAIKSMEALADLVKVETTVLRSGSLTKIAARSMVPGDIVHLEAGDLVTADIRVISASKLQVDESTLTGESVPVSKGRESVAPDTVLAERSSMLHKGTTITRGTTTGIVVATGTGTELGKISKLVQESHEFEPTPLERKLEKLGQNLVWLTIAITLLVVIGGYVQGKDLYIMIETAIALAVATVPEGLPIVATSVLAVGMWRMSKRNALVNKLSSVETLGSTSIICTDKTGTLTENKMTVVEILLPNESIEVTGSGLDTEGSFLRSEKEKPIDVSKEEGLLMVLQIGVLCNNASVNSGDGQTFIGDPMEVALLVVGEKAGLVQRDLRSTHEEVHEVSFDSASKMMATYNQYGKELRVMVKGSPSEVLESCETILDGTHSRPFTEKDKKEWTEKNVKIADRGLRVLAMATRTVGSVEEEPYKGLTFLGLVGLVDPPREEVKLAIEACRRAGIRVVMVTGDQAPTAQYVARKLSLVEEGDDGSVAGHVLKDPENLSDDELKQILQTPIFARVTPEQKLNLVKVHQKAGSVVAMTGDGVNDAPALQKADIGVAMGKRGTQVAKEASDMILQDDNFATIVMAVEQGRTIFENIRKFSLYLLSCNISEIMIIFIATMLGWPLPLLPLQILFLNVVTDIFPAFALSGGKGSPGIMEQPPRDREEKILTRSHWFGVFSYGLLLSAAVLGAFGWAYFIEDLGLDVSVTISFLTLALGQTWHVFNMRNRGGVDLMLKNEVTTNPYVWGALVTVGVIVMTATYLPGLSTILSTVDPGLIGWLGVLIFSLTPLALGQLLKLVNDSTVERFERLFHLVDPSQMQ